MLEGLFDVGNMRRMADDLSRDSEINYDIAAGCLTNIEDTRAISDGIEDFASEIMAQYLDVATRAAHIGRRYELAANIAQSLVNSYAKLKSITYFDGGAFDAIMKINREVDDLHATFLYLAPINGQSH